MSPANTSNSGIRTDKSTGTAFIPSSTRPDGSTRKEIRVRPGYRPPEDVELYKNRTADAFKKRGTGGIPGAEVAEKDSQPKTKNAKRREAARQRSAAEEKAGDVDDDQAEDQANGALKAVANVSGRQTSAVASAPSDEDAGNEKKARNLKKKLRQAKDLQGKKEKGESLLPEQFAKVLKIHELIRDLDKLGFDENGDKKTAGEG